jgi:hypothetical protein
MSTTKEFKTWLPMQSGWAVTSVLTPTAQKPFLKRLPPIRTYPPTPKESRLGTRQRTSFLP